MQTAQFLPSTYSNPTYPYRPSPDQKKNSAHHPVVVVGAGPAGVGFALDMGLQGIPVVLLDDNNTVSVGSRAICFSKRTLEICNRYGCAERMVKKGVVWSRGKVFFGSDCVYEFDLLPESGYQMPAFINLQQYYFEEYLVERAMEVAQIDLRWKHRAEKILGSDDAKPGVHVSTPDGPYQITCDYLVLADGANGELSNSLDLCVEGQEFDDHFLIVDVVMQSDTPPERWFWFDPPFHRGQSVLLHSQPDNVWRIDFQLGRDADIEQERKPEKIIPRLKAMLGEDAKFEIEWSSIYTFKCRKRAAFRRGNVFLLGDSAHQVSPFGARGANGAMQSVENLAWKMTAVLKQQAPAPLLDTYDSERQIGADENILNSSRATDFISPKNRATRLLRNAVLQLATDYPFARSLINSGRLSTPAAYSESPLNSADSDAFAAGIAPGHLACDAPIVRDEQEGWLLQQLGGAFALLVDARGVAEDELGAFLRAVEPLGMNVLLLGDKPDAQGFLYDAQGLLAQRYDILSRSVYLFRPDQYVCARWRSLNPDAIAQALARALGKNLPGDTP